MMPSHIIAFNTQFVAKSESFAEKLDPGSGQHRHHTHLKQTNKQRYANCNLTTLKVLYSHHATGCFTLSENSSNSLNLLSSPTFSLLSFSYLQSI